MSSRSTRLSIATWCGFRVRIFGAVCVGVGLACAQANAARVVSLNLCTDALLVELKCAERLGDSHLAQCLNYLKASGLELCLLVNFQRTRVEVKRVVLG